MSQNEEVFDKHYEEIIEALPKQKPPRARKGSNKKLAQEKKPTGTVPAMVEQGTRAWEIAEMVKAGKTLKEIKSSYGLSKETIENTMREAMKEMQESAAPIIFNFVNISIMRIEHMISKIFDQLADDDGHVNDPMMARFQSLISQEQEIVALLIPKKGQDATGGNVYNFNMTVQSDSKLYQMGMDAINQNQLGSGAERESEISDMDNPFDGIIRPG